MHLLAVLSEKPYLPSDNGRSSYDLAHAVSDNRLVGLWQLMRGFRWTYLAATVTLGLGAFARTGTYLWLRYFVDEILNSSPTISTLSLVALGFLGLALIQGGFTFLSGSLAAKTA